jgi:dipeptidyl aminopeptidase/acylaminoacyl peptidase
MNVVVKTASHGFWSGLFDVRALFEKPSTPMYPAGDGAAVYWLEARAEEGGRVVLMQRQPSGIERCLTPPAFSVRSRVHEYGGNPYTLHGGNCYFVNDGDQRIYILSLDGGFEPAPLTPPAGSGAQRRYIDLCVTEDDDHLICVMETEVPGAENENALAAIRIEPGVIHEPKVLQGGSDFYANPVLDPTGRRVAWIQWNHPYMPWDRSAAMIARYSRAGGSLRLDGPQCVVDEPDTSVCQLAFDADGDLLLAVDGESAPAANGNYWNLYRWHAGTFTPLTSDDREYGAPHWVFGDRRYAVLQDDILAVRTGPEGDELVRVDKHGGGVEPIETDAVDIRQLCRAGPDEVLMVAAAGDRSPTLTQWKRGRLIAVKRVEELLPREAVSRPMAIEFQTGDRATAHAYFYAPCNPACRAPENELPPLLVMMHGGPTARCSNALDLTRQYWTGIGFAVLDVNYRGSTGYGRAYRQSLLGEWGVADTQDVVKGIEHVARQGWIDRRRVFIRGRSAGGYGVLSALTRYPDAFAAGACYYGIGNLVTLAQITHKFEARYTDRLIGEAYQAERAENPDSRFYQRSPIRFVSAVRCPLIVFQGLEDKVVPPEVSREISGALEHQGLDYDYIEYPGEGHGFRSSSTNIDALERETAFFRRALSGTINDKHAERVET